MAEDPLCTHAFFVFTASPMENTEDLREPLWGIEIPYCFFCFPALYCTLSHVFSESVRIHLSQCELLIGIKRKSKQLDLFTVNYKMTHAKCLFGTLRKVHV